MISKSHVNKKLRYNKLKLYIIIFLLLISLIFIVAFKTSYFSIKDIVIENNRVLSENDIISYSGINIGQNIFKLKLSEVEEKIKNNPFIKNVTIKRKLPDKIIIEVKERNMIAALYYMGIYFYIDNEGVVLKTGSKSEEVCIIDGFEFKSFKEGERIKVENNKDFNIALTLCKLIRNSNLEITPTIYYNDGNFDIIINDNFLAKFGDGKDITFKFKVFISILNDFKKKNINSGIVDLRYSGYTIYRPFVEQEVNK